LGRGAPRYARSEPPVGDLGAGRAQPDAYGLGAGPTSVRIAVARSSSYSSGCQAWVSRSLRSSVSAASTSLMVAVCRTLIGRVEAPGGQAPHRADQPWSGCGRCGRESWSASWSGSVGRILRIVATRDRRCVMASSLDSRSAEYPGRAADGRSMPGAPAVVSQATDGLMDSRHDDIAAPHHAST
jgi:hypothetical protein